MGKSCEEVLSGLLDVWVERMDNVVQHERKKLLALSLLSLLQSNLR